MLKYIGSTIDPQKPTVVLLHGYGANCQDLAPLGSVLDAEQRFNWIFPDAPLEVPIGPSWTGRGWFNLRMEALDEAARAGTMGAYRLLKPPHVDEAAALVIELVEKLDLPWDKVILGGFSQGAMISCEVTLGRGKTPKGLLVLSGSILNEKTWSSAAVKNLPIFLSHGETDPLLPVKDARDLAGMLQANGGDVTSVFFRGGHEIPPQVLQGLYQFLPRLI